MKLNLKLGVMAHACSYNTQQVDAGRLMKIWSSMASQGDLVLFVGWLLGWMYGFVLKKMTNKPYKGNTESDCSEWERHDHVTGL